MSVKKYAGKDMVVQNVIYQERKTFFFDFSPDMGGWTNLSSNIDSAGWGAGGLIADAGGEAAPSYSDASVATGVAASLRYRRPFLIGCDKDNSRLKRFPIKLEKLKIIYYRDTNETISFFVSKKSRSGSTSDVITIGNAELSPTGSENTYEASLTDIISDLDSYSYYLRLAFSVSGGAQFGNTYIKHLSLEVNMGVDEAFYVCR